jgi:hypothetical protein
VNTTHLLQQDQQKILEKQIPLNHPEIHQVQTQQISITHRQVDLLETVVKIGAVNS